MSAFVETCSTTSAADSFVANGGIEKIPNSGYLNALLWVSDDFSGTPAELKDIETYNAGVQANQVIFLGNGKFEDTSTEATEFEDAELGIKVEQTAKIKSVTFTLATCACTSAQLEKMENKSGRLFMQTSTSALWGRYEDGVGKGFPVSSISVDSTLPVSDTPVEYTTLDITFSDHKGDRRNPLRLALDFLFSEIDQVFSAEGLSKKEDTSTSGSVLTGVVTVTKDCTTEKLEGLVAGDFKAADINGNVLPIASISESSGVYTINVTTDLTKVFISTDGIKEKSGVLYYMNPVTVEFEA